ncbi:MAG: hypothetical protein DRJ38_08490 [Thermoprotei archaeon]|nr:MAG: hypothetical protein DRJ38_08490 [Thermoprotei archaeon]
MKLFEKEGKKLRELLVSERLDEEGISRVERDEAKPVEPEKRPEEKSSEKKKFKFSISKLKLKKPKLKRQLPRLRKKPKPIVFRKSRRL